MSKPNTLQELCAETLVTQGGMNKIAKSIFTGTTEIFGGVEVYVITLPDFDVIPDSCQQFIRKALMFSKVENVLDYDERTAEVAEPYEDLESL